MNSIRKIASVLASTVMIGSSVALAAATTFPDPFVKSGAANVAVVYGANANVDLVAVMDITNKLSSELAAQTASDTTSGGSSTVSGGDFVKIEKSTDKFNLGNNLNSFYSTLDSEQLSTVLKSGTYSNDDNNEYDFDQKIQLGSNTLQHFENDDFNNAKPVIGFQWADGNHVMNYTLEFTPDAAENSVAFGAANSKLETTDLPMLGRTYYVQDTLSTANGVKLTLLDSANSAIVTEGETKTVKVGETSYDVSIVFISSDSVKLNVNGVTTNSLSEGGVYKVAADTYIAVKDIMARDKTGTTDKVEISIGSGKIVMENGQEVEVNEKKVSDLKNADGTDKYPASLTAYYTNTSTAISKIILSWDINQDAWTAPGSDLIMPGFETVKLSMGAFNVDKKEVTKLESSSDSIKLSTFDSKGAVDLYPLYLNSTNGGIAGIGKASNHVLVTAPSTATSITLNKTQDPTFVASYSSGDVGESYVLKIDSISDSDSSKNTTTIKSVADGSTKSIDFGDNKDWGNVRLTLSSANPDTKLVTLAISDASGGSGTVNFNRVITKEGLQIRLPVINATSADSRDGFITINATTPNPTQHIMNFSEADKDGNIAAGQSFVSTIGLDSSSTPNLQAAMSLTPAVFSNSKLYQTEDGSDVYVGYVKSDLATKVTYDKGADPDKLDIEYHGSQAFADVFVSESMASVIASSGSTTTSTGVQALGSVSVKDSEVSSVSTKNLVVVGGSCVNTVAAKLLGSDSPICGDEFTTKTGVSSGQYLIQTFASPYSSSNVATLVAGFNAGDTTNAGKYFTTQPVDTTVGKKYIGTSQTSATVSTVTASATADTTSASTTA